MGGSCTASAGSAGWLERCNRPRSLLAGLVDRAPGPGSGTHEESQERDISSTDGEKHALKIAHALTARAWRAVDGRNRSDRSTAGGESRRAAGLCWGPACGVWDARATDSRLGIFLRG